MFTVIHTYIDAQASTDVYIARTHTHTHTHTHTPVEPTTLSRWEGVDGSKSPG
jgi:hypothetical protein